MWLPRLARLNLPRPSRLVQAGCAGLLVSSLALAVGVRQRKPAAAAFAVLYAAPAADRRP